MSISCGGGKMQVKCQRCDKLFNQVSTEKYCSDCLAGKPVVRYTPPKKEDGSICVVCGKRFYPKNKLKKTCGWDCTEARRKEQNKAWRINNKK